jgi:hypothetical protein
MQGTMRAATWAWLLILGVTAIPCEVGAAATVVPAGGQVAASLQAGLLQPVGMPMTPSYPDGRPPSIPDERASVAARSSSVPPPAAKDIATAERGDNTAALPEQPPPARPRRAVRYRYSYYRYQPEPFGRGLSGAGYGPGP